MKPSTVFFLTIIAILTVFILIIHSNLQKTELLLSETMADLKTKEYENKKLKESVEKQNAEIEKIQVEYTSSVKELEIWKRKKAEIKYVTIEKIREVKSNECNDTSTVIDAVRDIDFSKL